MVWSEIVWFQIMNLMVWAGSGVGKSACWAIMSIPCNSLEDPLPKARLQEPLTRYVKLRVAHAPGMLGAFSPPQPLWNLTDTSMTVVIFQSNCTILNSDLYCESCQDFMI